MYACISTYSGQDVYLEVPPPAVGLVQHGEMVGGVHGGQVMEDVVVRRLGYAHHRSRLSVQGKYCTRSKILQKIRCMKTK